MQKLGIMPGLAEGTSKKRKRPHEANEEPTKLTPTATSIGDSRNVSIHISNLEKLIMESCRNYNSISTLLGYIQNDEESIETQYLAVLSLCRVFCRLMLTGGISRFQGTTEKDRIVVGWLRKRYYEYQALLLQILMHSDPQRQNGLLELITQLLKGETRYLAAAEELFWKDGILPKMLLYCVEAQGTNTTSVNSLTRSIKTLAEHYYDVRFFIFKFMGEISSLKNVPMKLDNVITILGFIGPLSNATNSASLFADRQDNNRLMRMEVQKRRAQETWTAILRQDLNNSQRKALLGMMSDKIVPTFSQLEMLMDFLTDSFSAGGSISLLALSELFHLIQEKNLDYPQFYQKLYSLLDSNVLHSKHRSQFFRLLNGFLASTHLPGALVASFIKRLSRLCLYSPPSGILATVPWIYNLFKLHPICAFTIHRTTPINIAQFDYDLAIGEDCFRDDECDPMATHAERSSLWEIESLQSHYHPNVATMAKIISEQFTKQSYLLEDFLDHSYSSILDAELSRSINKPPVVEYTVPKRIYVSDSQEERKNLLVDTWEFK